jgi:hypothetical protein
MQRDTGTQSLQKFTNEDQFAEFPEFEAFSVTSVPLRENPPSLQDLNHQAINRDTR